MLQSAVKTYAVAHGIPVLQPPKLKNPEFLAELRDLQADLQVVVAFRMLPEAVWNMPPKGTLNLHGSLLPRYRGAAPINWAIINGETETGVTTFLLKHEIDTGDVLFQERIPIGENETAGELHDRMMHIGAQLVLKTVQSIEQGHAQPQPQDLSVVSLAPKIFTETCQIDFAQSTRQVHDFVRGLSPFPGAWTFFDERTLKILRTEKDDTTPLKGKIGQFFSDGRHYLAVRTNNGYVQITDLQLEGKKRMSVRDFLNGYKFNWISF